MIDILVAFDCAAEDATTKKSSRNYPGAFSFWCSFGNYLLSVLSRNGRLMAVVETMVMSPLDVTV